MTGHRFRHIALGDVGSTNDEARQRIASLAGEEFVVTGVRQLAGRGRRGRSWVSPAGNVYASFVVRPGAPTHRLPELSFVAALAVAGAVDDIIAGKASVRCKWPNDVLVDGAKVCGILLETAPDGGGGLVVIVGIGINVVSKPSDTPYPAVALAEVVPWARSDAVFDALRHALANRVELWEREGFAKVRELWLERVDGVGGPIVARLADGEVHGTFTGLDESGALLLTDAEGKLHRITAGDVFRPSPEV